MNRRYRRALVYALGAVVASVGAWYWHDGSSSDLPRAVAHDRRAERPFSSRRVALRESPPVPATRPVRGVESDMPADLAASWSDGPVTTERATQIVRLVRDWAAAAPTDAWRWVLQHPSVSDGDEEFSLLGTVLRLVAERDPSTAVAWADAARVDGTTIPPAGLLAELCTALLATEHPSMAQGYLNKLACSPAGALVGPQPLTNVGLYLIAHQSPEAAMHWLAELPASAGRDSALVAVASEWTQHDAAAAVAWTLGSDISPNSLQAIIGAWAQRDSVTAAEWLQTHDSTPRIDTLIHGFVFHSSIATDAPAAAQAWASLIHDDNLRRQSLAALAQPANEGSP